MRPTLLALALAAAVVLPGSASANLIVGINDDVKAEASQPSFFMSTMAADGLKTDALTIRWDETQSTAMDPVVQDDIQQVIAAAATAGVTVVLDLYPLHSQVLTNGTRCRASIKPSACGDTARIQQFAAWTATIAQTFPTVHQFIVMNECNQPLFLNPQWTRGGVNQSAAVCGRALAAAYDALKAVSSSNFVWGLGLSPRGNDAPSAASNSSTSPVEFLGALGVWFRAFAQKTHRRSPLMDGLDFHPYPVPQSIPFASGYADPFDASISNLPRIYQAFYEAFTGTPQRTIGQQKGGGLPLSLNEMGIQTRVSGHFGYTGLEVSANAAGGVRGPFATQSYQATYYEDTLERLACDPNVRVIDIYRLVDDPNLAGWQSGLYWVGDGTPVPKESATMLAAWMAKTHGACRGKMVPWTPEKALTPPGVRDVALTVEHMFARLANACSLGSFWRSSCSPRRSSSSGASRPGRQALTGPRRSIG
jgi:hypothetical protein